MGKKTVKAGDVVALRSGGPRMTVVSLRDICTGALALCTWFDRELSALEAEFAPAVLVKCDSNCYAAARLQAERGQD
jgi:uncharacterized protein YodC (DUF2158 family)